jgi:hypothetical protein
MISCEPLAGNSHGFESGLAYALFRGQTAPAAREIAAMIAEPVEMSKRADAIH